MKQIVLLAGVFLVGIASGASAAGLDGNYRGISETTEYAGDPTAYSQCGDRVQITLTVAGSAITYGKLTGKLEADGSFKIEGNTGADNASLLVQGVIRGESLKARWLLKKQKVDCAGDISARR